MPDSTPAPRAAPPEGGALAAVLAEMIESFWGDWTAGPLRERFRRDHPDHVAVRAEQALAAWRAAP